MPGLILVVDDDPDSRGWVVEALHLAGYETKTATNGDEALRALLEMNPMPRAILLDLMMPLMDGWDVIASLRRRADRPKILVMSGHHKGIPAGADAMLRKPIDVDTLLAAVREACP